MTNDDWLTRELARDDVVRDEGFTDRVLGALPPRSRKLSEPARAAIVLTAASAAAALALFAFDGASFLSELAGTDVTGLLKDARSTAMAGLLLAAVVVTSVAVAQER